MMLIIFIVVFGISSSQAASLDEILLRIDLQSVQIKRLEVHNEFQDEKIKQLNLKLESQSAILEKLKPPSGSIQEIQNQTESNVFHQDSQRKDILVIATGSSENGSKKTEIFNLGNVQNQCENLSDFPIELSFSMEGFISDAPTICGGFIVT